MVSDVVKGVLIGVLVAYLPLLVRAAWRRVRAWLARRAERTQWDETAYFVYRVLAARDGVDPQEAARRWLRLSPLERTRWAAEHADDMDEVGEDDFALLPENLFREMIVQTYGNLTVDEDVDRHAVQVVLEQQLTEALLERRDRRYERLLDACEEVGTERRLEPGSYGSLPDGGEPDELDAHPAWRQALLELADATSKADIRAIAERQLDRLQERWEAERRVAERQARTRAARAAGTRAGTGRTGGGRVEAPVEELPTLSEFEPDPGAEPGIEETAPVDRAVLAGLSADVLVVDGRPRYHRAGCAYLRGHEPEALPVGEAVELGFTPCVHCGPNGALLRQPGGSGA